MKRYLLLLNSLVLWIASIPLMASPDVQLLHGYSSIGSRYGTTWQNSLIEIAVKKAVDPETQNVSVVVDDCNGGWAVVDAAYDAPMGDLHERWVIDDVTKVFPVRSTGDAFYNEICDLILSVKYDFDGKTVWDNNFNRNHYIPANGGAYLTSPVLLDEAYLSRIRHVRGNTLFNGSIYLQNISQNKKVYVVYTTDGWLTENVVEARYEPFQNYGYSTVPSPNGFGVEYWTFSTILNGVDEVEFAISYGVGAQQIWDNNWGGNYLLTAP
ncbi:MAG: hypothetical protein HRU19_10270 [Pseudobacteriovorax sp.]|nr:hypothetical protein [Pseudobacteriovorax sp.]